MSYYGTAIPTYGRAAHRCYSPSSACWSAAFIGLGAKSYPAVETRFRARQDIRLQNSDPSGAAFRLQEEASTLSVYPFRFELEVRYEISGRTLSLDTAIRNLGETDMPASFGYHPAFRWPLPFGQPRASHSLNSSMKSPLQ